MESGAKAAKAGRGTYPAAEKRKEENRVIREAMAILEGRLRKPKRKRPISNVTSAIKLAQLLIGDKENELFWVAFLNSQHQLIDHRVMFTGTIDGATVHPREVVKEALRLNASAVIFAHNHPSGSATPSRADVDITSQLRRALILVDVKVLDHLVIGGTKATSMAEVGVI